MHSREVAFGRIVELVKSETMHLELTFEEAHMVKRSLTYWRNAADRKRNRILEEHDIDPNNFEKMTISNRADIEHVVIHVPRHIATVDGILARITGGGDNEPPL